MSGTLEFLSEVRRLGITLSVEGGRLRYSGPPAALSEPVLVELRRRKEEILAILRDASAVAQGASTPLPRVPRGQETPLSFAQERLWFLDQLDPGSPAYNIPSALRLEGELDLTALRRSLDEIVRRHEVLRTTLTAQAGRPQAHLQPPEPVELPVEDLQSLGAEAAEARVRRRAAEEAARPFDLARAPLLRVVLLRLAPRRHVALFTMHHVASDGWSLGVLVRELGDLYRAAVTGAATPLAEPAVQYADFAAWQRQDLAGERLERLVGYWRDRLHGAPPVLELPLARPTGGGAPGSHGARERRLLGAGLSEALRECSRREGVSLYMVLLAGFLALLQRYAGRHDLVVGTPVHGRPRRELEELIGFFVNTLVLRVELGGDPTVRDLLGRVRECVLGALAHAELPFEQLVEHLQPERSLAHQPLFQIMFVLQNVPGGTLDLPGLRLTPLESGSGAAKFDLTLALEESPAGLGATVDYRTDLFEAAAVRRLLGHYEVLLEGLAGDPGRRVASLPLLTRDELERTVVTFNRTPAPSPPLEPVHAAFERQARTAPQAPALVAGALRWSFAELNARAEALARRLRARGLVAEQRVALCLPRDAHAVVAVLAVLKAGAAYVPIEPGLPPERREFMLRDSGAVLVLTVPELRRTFEGAVPVLVLGAGEHAEHAPAAGAERVPGGTVDLDALAYVLYTSGSTGWPKGVMVTHRGLANYVAWSSAAYLGADGGAPLHSPLGFDLTVTALLTPLAGGRTVTLVEEEGGLGALAEALRAKPGFALVKLTPSHLVALGGLLAAEDAGAARTLVVGGEALRYDALDFFRRHAPRTRVVNEYGPTECVVGCCVFEFDAGVGGAGNVPIGRPIANTELYVLDDGLLPVPEGVPGELYVGGVGLARGYLGRPALTADRFVPRPLGGAPGERLYRTGDRVRRLPDGLLEYLGRTDEQVKLRGFRVELGEVEAALGAHPDVAAAAAAVHTDRRGQHRLVGYVVPRAGTLDAAGVSACLARRLPEYMQPSVLVPLDALPLSGNGKVDRRALPPPDGVPAPRTAHVAPRNLVEERLAGLWCELLDVPQVSVLDDFFALGGHSLLATQMVARVRQAFGVDLELRRLFAGPTVEQLARAVMELRAAGAVPELPVIVPDPARRHEPFPLTDVQQAYWIGRSGAVELGDVATYSYFEFDFAELDLDRFEDAWNTLVARHGMLRAVVLPDGRQQILGQVPRYAVERLDLRGAAPLAAEQQLAQLRERLSHQVLSSERWPLFDVRAVLLEGGRVRLQVGIDALIRDAWSGRILARELWQIYTGQAGLLAPIELSFRDYVLGVAALKDAPAYQRSRAYWWARIDGLPPAPELPLARDPSTLRAARFVRRSASLPEAEWSRLKERGARAGLTPSGVLLAAFSEVLARWSKSRRFTLNLTLFQRHPLHPQVYDIVGDFTSLTLLAVDPPAGSFEERARHLQARLWEDLDHGYESGVGVPHELMRRRRGGGARALMPVVFTSTLGHEAPARAAAAENAEASTADAHGGLVYGISQTPQVFLDHQVGEHAGRLLLSWDAVEALFPSGLLDDMFTAYVELLRHLSGGAETWTAPLPNLLPGHQRTLFAAVNQTEAPLPGGLLHAPFERQARLHPERLAVVAGRHRLGYGELLRAAVALGTQLRRRGAQPDTLVAVVMEKGWEQIAAVLGVLHAGAAYLPLSPELPPARLAQLIEHGRVRVALTQPWIDARLEWPRGLVRVSVDDACRGAVAPALAPIQSPRDLAYVIYTSGSTGEPKGVMVDHRGALNTVSDVNARFEVGPDDRVLALSSLAFDLSVYDVFGLLGVGGAVVVPEAGSEREPGHWAELLRRERITVWNSVPALAEMLAEHLAGRAETCPADLRTVLLSGDWLPVTLPEKLRALGCRARLASLGGATEASIWSILYPIADVPPDWPSIPYGKPMLNQRFHVLDEDLETRPLWVPGQLAIGGVGLAQGYWRDEERTRASFFEHPRTGERLYHTGDMGRFLPDGNIEFLGREDAQVKVQGYRIELGEIEAALGRHPALQAAAAGVFGERRHRRLVGYYVARLGADVGALELGEFLRGKLPRYMVPSVFVALEALPLSANGKVDRKALPSPGAAEPAAAVPPETPTEQRLAELWVEVLHLERVSRQDNFFELGGDSLLATQLASRVRDAFRVDLPLRQVFEAGTLEALARAVDALAAQAAAAVPALVARPRIAVKPPALSREPS